MNVFTDTFVTRYYEIKGFCPTEKIFVMTDLHGCSPETVHDKNFVPLWTNFNGGDKTLDSFDSAINNGAEYRGVL